MKYAVVCAGGPVTEIADLAEFRNEEHGIYRSGPRGSTFIAERELSRMKQLAILIPFQKVNTKRLLKRYVSLIGFVQKKMKQILNLL